jgi:hypothetical protein
MRHKQMMEQRDQERKHRREELGEQQESDRTAIDFYRDLAERLEKQNGRWEQDSQAKQRLIEHLAERDNQCQVRLARYWVWITQATGRIEWLTRLARDAGHDPGESLCMPQPPPEFDDTPGFRARSSAQNTANIAATNPVPPPLQP